MIIDMVISDQGLSSDLISALLATVNVLGSMLILSQISLFASIFPGVAGVSMIRVGLINFIAFAGVGYLLPGSYYNEYPYLSTLQVGLGGALSYYIAANFLA